MLKILGVGDVMLGDTHHRWGAGMGRLVARRPGEVFQLPGGTDADVSVINLEAPVVPEKLVGMPFAVSDQALAALDGFPGKIAVCLANNHIGEYGRQGVEHTVSKLEDRGFLPLGFRLREERFFVDVPVGGQVCRVANFCLLPGPCSKYFFTGSEEDLVALARNLSSEGRPWLLSLHWGREYATFPLQRQVRLAETLFSLGCTAILGHHSHTTQPVWDAGGRVCAFGLGNFVFDMIFTPEITRGLGIVLELEGDIARISGLFRHTRKADLTPEASGLPLRGEEGPVLEGGVYPGVLEDEADSAPSIENQSRRGGKRLLFRRLMRGEIWFFLKFLMWRLVRRYTRNDETGFWRLR
jgi:hypothetical protein